MRWEERAETAIGRYRSGETREADQRQLTQLGNAAWAAGLSLLMCGRVGEARAWLGRAAARYGESWREAPPDSWGRPIAMQKALLLGGGDAREVARAALGAGAAEAESPIGRYAGALALLVLGDDGAAAPLASTLCGRDDFPPAVADALVALATADRDGYRVALEAIVESFESRTEFLEDVPVADTVLVLQVLAAARGLAAVLPPSSLVP